MRPLFTNTRSCSRCLRTVLLRICALVLDIGDKACFLRKSSHAFSLLFACLWWNKTLFRTETVSKWCPWAQRRTKWRWRLSDSRVCSVFGKSRVQFLIGRQWSLSELFWWKGEWGDSQSYQTPDGRLPQIRTQRLPLWQFIIIHPVFQLVIRVVSTVVKYDTKKRSIDLGLCTIFLSIGNKYNTHNASRISALQNLNIWLTPVHTNYHASQCLSTRVPREIVEQMHTKILK